MRGVVIVRGKARFDCRTRGSKKKAYQAAGWAEFRGSDFPSYQTQTTEIIRNLVREWVFLELEGLGP